MLVRALGSRLAARRCFSLPIVATSWKRRTRSSRRRCSRTRHDPARGSWRAPARWWGGSNTQSGLLCHAGHPPARYERRFSVRSSLLSGRRAVLPPCKRGPRYGPIGRGVKDMPIGTIASKGQVTTTKPDRDALDLQPGGQMIWTSAMAPSLGVFGAFRKAGIVEERTSTPAWSSASRRGRHASGRGCREPVRSRQAERSRPGSAAHRRRRDRLRPRRRLRLRRRARSRRARGAVRHGVLQDRR